MYAPRHFAVGDEDRLFDFINQTTVATLITEGADGMTANQVPLLLNPHARQLWGHLARPNPQLDELATGKPVLVNFLGPSGYISPSWYADTGLVPTWNFVSVQVRGIPRIHDDTEAVRDITRRLTELREAPFDPPWTMDKVPAERHEKLLAAIVGFRIDITDVQGKFKLSQNRSAEDRAGAIAGLRSMGDHGSLALADCMETEVNGEEQ